MSAKRKYRRALEEAKFVNTIGIEDSAIIQRIRLNYRLLLLRDTAAPRWIEESTLGLLTNVSDSFILVDDCQ